MEERRQEEKEGNRKEKKKLKTVKGTVRRLGEERSKQSLTNIRNKQI